MKLITAICLIAFMPASYAQVNSQANVDINSANKFSAISTNSFKECAAVSMWAVSPKDLNRLVDSGLADKPENNDLLEAAVKIPPGWSVVGTSSHSLNSGQKLWLFICH